MIDCSRMYLLDRDGFVVLIDEYVSNQIKEVVHVTKVEPLISRMLIDEGILIRDNCTITQSASIRRKYIVSSMRLVYQL